MVFILFKDETDMNIVKTDIEIEREREREKSHDRYYNKLNVLVT